MSSTENFEKIGVTTSVSLKRNTKLTWKEWIQILNSAGGVHMNYQQIVALLKKKYKTQIWWSHIIANGYEVAIGRRLPGQSLKGTYSVTVTKTIHMSKAKAYEWLTSKDAMAIWLKPLNPIKISKGQVFETENGVYGEVRTFKKNQRIRLSWNESDGEKASVVQIFLYGQKNKCGFGIQHENLKNAREKINKRDYWKKALDDLVAMLDTSR